MWPLTIAEVNVLTLANQIFKYSEKRVTLIWNIETSEEYETELLNENKANVKKVKEYEDICEKLTKDLEKV